MKLPLAVGLLSLLPISVWALPVASSMGASDASFAAQAGAQRSLGGMAFGGFFTLYSFAVISPLVPAAAVLQIAAVVPADNPAVGSPYAPPMVDDLEAVGVPDDAPAVLLVQPTAPALPVDKVDTGWVAVPPPQVAADPIGFDLSPALPAATELPEPSTLSLAALAAVALLTWTGSRRPPQPRSSRRRILPTGLFGRSSRNSTIFGRL